MWYYVSAELGDTASVAGRDEYAGMISEEERLAAEAMARQWLAKFKGG